MKRYVIELCNDLLRNCKWIHKRYRILKIYDACMQGLVTDIEAVKTMIDVFEEGDE